MFKLVIFCLVIVASATVDGASKVQRSEWQSIQKQPANFCQGCRSIVSFGQTFNESSKRSAWKEVFNGFCENYYPVSTDYQQGPCPLFIESIFYLIDKIDPVYHCDQIGACPPSLAAASSKSIVKLQSISSNEIPSRGSGIVCEACEQVLSQFQAQLTNPKFVDLIHQQVESLCDYLKIVDQDKQCKQFVLRYLDQAIDFVRTLSPEKYCQSIQLCSKQQQQLTSGDRQLPTLADFDGFGIETSVEIRNPIITTDLVNNNNRPTNKTDEVNNRHTPNCLFCKTFVKEMFRFLKENRTEDRIREGLEYICRIVPQNELQQCEHMVEAYAKELIELLIDETDPEMICILLEQCNSAPEETTYVNNNNLKQAEPISFGTFINMLEPKIQVGSIFACVECKLFIQYLQNEFHDTKSKTEMKNWLLNNLCHSLEDKSLRNSCIEMVNDKADAFFDAVVNQLDPHRTCIDIGTCSAKTTNNLVLDNSPSFSLAQDMSWPIVEQVLRPIIERPKIMMVKISTTVCDQCVGIITQLDEYLSTHSVDHDISLLIDQVCNKLPQPSMQQACTFYVKTYGQEIIAMIESMDNPRQLCTKLSLC